MMYSDNIDGKNNLKSFLFHVFLIIILTLLEFTFKSNQEQDSKKYVKVELLHVKPKLEEKNIAPEVKKIEKIKENVYTLVKNDNQPEKKNDKPKLEEIKKDLTEKEDKIIIKSYKVEKKAKVEERTEKKADLIPETLKLNKIANIENFDQDLTIQQEEIFADILNDEDKVDIQIDPTHIIVTALSKRWNREYNDIYSQNKITMLTQINFLPNGNVDSVEFLTPDLNDTAKAILQKQMKSLIYKIIKETFPLNEIDNDFYSKNRSVLFLFSQKNQPKKK